MARTLNPTLRRGLTAGAVALGVFSFTHWLNLLGAIGAIYPLGEGADQLIWPSSVSQDWPKASLALAAVIASLPAALLVGLGGLLRRLIACLIAFGMWFVTGEWLSGLLTPDLGNTWAMWEGLNGPYWMGAITPGFAFISAVVIYITMDHELTDGRV